ncbi:MAG: hypothetical protein L0Z54_06380, partial [Thermoplasmata archaeon]|nr:hypothetical protein [Thermoplasmata archaeon]
MKRTRGSRGRDDRRVPRDGDGQPPDHGPRLHTERYTRWRGSLQERPRIVLDAALAGTRHALSSRWVKVLVGIAWVFTVFLPLLQASFGGLDLVQDPTDTPYATDPSEYWSRLGEYEMDLPPTAVIEGNSTATFSLSVLNRADIPDVITLRVAEVPPGWGV